jgi:hypothetical protein
LGATIFFILALLSLVLASPCFAAPPLLGIPKAASRPRFIEAFSPEQNPGKGTLSYKTGDKVRSIQLGGQSGFYGVGMIFHGTQLPDNFKQELKDRYIVQVALGNLTAKDKNLIPEFAAVTLILKKLPTEKKTVKTVMPTGKETKIDEGALILFSNPETPTDRADEEKLRGTYFANSGVLTLTPVGKPEVVDIRADNGHYKFKTQAMRMEFNSLLVTPFNVQPADMRGTLEIPIFWPHDKRSELFAKHIAEESLGTPQGGATPSEATPRHPRDLASPKNDPLAPSGH